MPVFLALVADSTAFSFLNIIAVGPSYRARSDQAERDLAAAAAATAAAAAAAADAAAAAAAAAADAAVPPTPAGPATWKRFSTIVVSAEQMNRDSPELFGEQRAYVRFPC
jgi:hypothetical protein